MPVDIPRRYGPTHLTLETCLEPNRPQVVQALAAHVQELQHSNTKLREQLGRPAPTPVATQQPSTPKPAEPAPKPAEQPTAPKPPEQPTAPTPPEQPTAPAS